MLDQAMLSPRQATGVLLFVGLVVCDRGTAQPGLRATAQRLVLAAADADGDGDVSAAEWGVFTGARAVGADGNLDRSRLKADLVMVRLDADRDGHWSGGELAGLWEPLDTDRNGMVEGDEMPGSGRAGRPAVEAGIVVPRADEDGDSAVSAAEWQAFLERTARVDGATVAEWVTLTEAAPPADRGAFTAATYLTTLDSSLDRDRNGVLTLADLQAVFGAVDGNADGAVTAAELRAAGRAPRAGRAGRRGWVRATEAQRAQPPLMAWQRSLEDAQALAAASGKPLLICVNMDGEPACESIAWYYYREPAFAALARGFVCVLASPDRRNPRDYDGRGRRIVDPKFGRLINWEHQSIEPTLYERYFNGRRVAPRHVGVSPSGEVLFDVFLVGDLSPVEEQLRTHGVLGPLPAAEDEAALLASPDAAHRERLEAGFLLADAAERARLAGLALDPARRTQHPDLLRLALCDPDPAVAAAARAAVVAAPELVTPLLFGVAWRRAPTEQTRTAVVAAAEARLAAMSEDDEGAAQLAASVRGWRGLLASVDWLDVDAWCARLAAADAAPIPSRTPDDLAALDVRIEQLEAGVAADDGDGGLRLELAAANMEYALIRAADGKDPSFLLLDARSHAQAAAEVGAPRARASAYVAWSSYLLNELEAAAPAARDAVSGLEEEAQTELACQALEVLAQCRTRDLYAAMSAGDEWPATWVAELAAVHRVLRAHPLATEAQLRAGLELLGQIDAGGVAVDAAVAAVARMPWSQTLHEQLRGAVLAGPGPRGMTPAYASLEIATDQRATVDWYQGLAELVAAEQLVRDREPVAALAGYVHSLASFDRAVAAAPAFADSAHHYQALAWAGSATLYGERGEWAAAAHAAARGLGLREATGDSEDGLGRTPRQRARDVLEQLAVAAPELAEPVRRALGQDG